jgi:transposase-like protein
MQNVMSKMSNIVCPRCISFTNVVRYNIILHSMQLNANGWHQKFQCCSYGPNNLNGSKIPALNFFHKGSNNYVIGNKESTEIHNNP